MMRTLPFRKKRWSSLHNVTQKICIIFVWLWLSRRPGIRRMCLIAQVPRGLHLCLRMRMCPRATSSCTTRCNNERIDFVEDGLPAKKNTMSSVCPFLLTRIEQSTADSTIFVISWWLDLLEKVHRTIIEVCLLYKLRCCKHETCSWACNWSLCLSTPEWQSSM